MQVGLRVIRARAIFFSLKYGALPWRLYEETCHYSGMGYFGHLWINLAQAARWIARRETADDRRFEAINQALPLFADIRWPARDHFPRCSTFRRVPPRYRVQLWVIVVIGMIVVLDMLSALIVRVDTGHMPTVAGDVAKVGIGVLAGAFFSPRDRGE